MALIERRHTLNGKSTCFPETLSICILQSEQEKELKMFDLKPIKLGYTSYEAYTDNETMQKIEALLQGNTYCHSCRQKFSEHKPEVAKSECLHCFLRKHSNLEDTGRVWHDKDGVPEYLFMDGRGHITMTSPDSPTVQESIWATLAYWGFYLPDSVKVNVEDVQLALYRWRSLYSHPKKWAVVATHQPTYGGKLLVFLLQKDGSTLLLDRRLKRVRDMLAQARADIVAGKAGREIEEYGSRYDPSDYQVYRRLADRISEQHEREAATKAS
jgi:hypothetical protein